MKASTKWVLLGGVAFYFLWDYIAPSLRRAAEPAKPAPGIPPEARAEIASVWQGGAQGGNLGGGTPPASTQPSSIQVAVGSVAGSRMFKPGGSLINGFFS